MNKFKNCRFSFEKENNILCDRHIGISGNRLSILTPESSVGKINNLQACPFTNTEFIMDVRVGGERVPAKDWSWLPNVIIREGETKLYNITTTVAVPPHNRAVVIKIELENKTENDLLLPLTVEYRGEPRRMEEWIFLIPDGNRFADLKYESDENSITFYSNDQAASVITCSEKVKHFKSAYLLESNITLPASKKHIIYFSAHLGAKEEVEKESQSIKKDYQKYIDKAILWEKEEEKEIFSKLPELTSTDSDLVKLYYRSLVTYVTNKWEAPEFNVNPYYSTGSTNGGCMCSYLWDYSGGMYVHPLVCPETHKKQLGFYIKNDLTSSYAIMPIDGKPTGPWYQINQEKIIAMVYYYVLHTGDKEFLNEKVLDKTISEWMVFHALVGDDLSKPVALINYGEGGRDHLELRHEIQYRGIMPDLNARRYMNYIRAYKLTELAGNPCEVLLDRASELKDLLPTLWNENAEWYDFIYNGNRETRYTVQMFKFLDSDVIDKQTKDKLVKHLNEEEFLSEYGLHSMAKHDPAYDQDDIDNGGGGICTEFAAVIIGQLFDEGYDEKASDILKRILWWGTRLPYMGDSCAANMMLHREDTPLQADISSVSLAQTILFKLSGVSVDFDGKIKVCPPKHHLAEKIEYRNFKLRGRIFDLLIDGEYYKLKIDGKTIVKKCGEISFV